MRYRVHPSALQRRTAAPQHRIEVEMLIMDDSFFDWPEIVKELDTMARMARGHQVKSLARPTRLVYEFENAEDGFDFMEAVEGEVLDAQNEQGAGTSAWSYFVDEFGDPIRVHRL